LLRENCREVSTTFVSGVSCLGGSSVAENVQHLALKPYSEWTGFILKMLWYD